MDNQNNQIENDQTSNLPDNNNQDNSNQKLFWISGIVVLIILIIVGGVFYFSSQKKAGQNQKNIQILDQWRACQQDSDCIETQAGCCSCSGGGKQTAINKKYLKQWKNILKNKCSRVTCIALAACRDGRPVCKNNKCEFKSNRQANREIEKICCQECKEAFKYSPVAIGADTAQCGHFSTKPAIIDKKCQEFFKDNNLTVAECTQKAITLPERTRKTKFLSLGECKKMGGEMIEISFGKEECPDQKVFLGMIKDVNCPCACCK
ncbi:MAG TPA: hypothetical protein ENL06_02165 [Candidatus Portnoybacteria bacterium]|nr:hypothetical protein [Candidatus Portnoybacteria bacterium]